MVTSEMHTHCQKQIKVKSIKGSWETQEACSEGHGPGILVASLLDHCMLCDKGERLSKVTLKEDEVETKSIIDINPEVIERHFKSEDGVIYKADAMDTLAMLGNESVDLCIFDPPYPSMEKWRSTGTTTRLTQSKSSSNDWFDVLDYKYFPKLFAELFRVMKKGTFVYMFCDEETRDMVTAGYSPQTDTALRIDRKVCSPVVDAGFKYWKAIVWDKIVPGMGYHFKAQHEFIIMLEKVVKKNKHRKLNENKGGDIITCKRLKGKQYYPTQKPDPIIWKLITESSNLGNLILDPFMGAGGVPYMAMKTGRKFVAGDVSDLAVKTTLERLK